LFYKYFRFAPLKPIAINVLGGKEALKVWTLVFCAMLSEVVGIKNRPIVPYLIALSIFFIFILATGLNFTY
jgi:hypothetical protein